MYDMTFFSPEMEDFSVNLWQGNGENEVPSSKSKPIFLVVGYSWTISSGNNMEEIHGNSHSCLEKPRWYPQQ